MSSVLNAPHFHDEEAAYAWVEARVWPRGPVCAHCGSVERISKMAGKSTRIGVYKCYACRKPFTVKIGTIFEASHVKMHLWLQAMFLMCSSKKGISSNQLHRVLGVTLKTAWFMSHRIREAMKDTNGGPLGGAGVTVEVDETFIGQKDSAYSFKNNVGWIPKKGPRAKRTVVSLVERNGRARSFHVENLGSKAVREILVANVRKTSTLNTDEANHYTEVGKEFRKHGHVLHIINQYVKPDGTSTNTIEGFFSIFKRGMRGVYQHCGEKHLHRYLAEFDFRYSNRAKLGVDDELRTERAVCGIIGKRLTYRTTHQQA